MPSLNSRELGFFLPWLQVARAISPALHRNTVHVTCSSSVGASSSSESSRVLQSVDLPAASAGPLLPAFFHFMGLIAGDLPRHPIGPNRPKRAPRFGSLLWAGPAAARGLLSTLAICTLNSSKLNTQRRIQQRHVIQERHVIYALIQALAVEPKGSEVSTGPWVPLVL